MDWITRGIRVRFSVGVRDYSLLQSVETGCGIAQPPVQQVPGGEAAGS